MNWKILVVAGVLEEPADSFEEVLNILDAGTAIRHVGAMHMNEISSRSHCIFTLILGLRLDVVFVFISNRTFICYNIWENCLRVKY